MRNISDTIARLTSMRAQRISLDAQTAVSGDGLTDLKEFGTNPGALRGRFYLPDNLLESAPLVVVLHGCTQNAAVYNIGSGWSQLADQEGFALLYPEQQRSNNANLCFNWFVPADIKRNSGEALSIRQMIEQMAVLHGLDRGKVYVTGLSAGGAMASVMLATYPEVFAGGAIIAGLPYGSANTVPEAFDRMRGHGGPSERELQKNLRAASHHKGAWPKISIWHGTADYTVSSLNADAIAMQWCDVHAVALAASRPDFVDGHTRKTWLDNKGRAVIEMFALDGMGHGTPLMTQGESGLGAAGPFMIEAGISSTRHIANSWGIADRTRLKSRRPKSKQTAATVPNTQISDLVKSEHGGPRRSAGSAPPSAVNGSPIKKIIEDALRAAGLMR